MLIMGELGDDLAGFELEFVVVQAEYVVAELHVDWAGYDLRFGSWYERGGLERFVAELEALHRTLDGVATLLSAPGVDELVFVVIDRGRGRIGVAGTFYRAIGGLLPEHYYRAIPNDADGLRVSFGGLVVDQSLLPALIQDVWGVLRRMAAL